MLSAYKVSKPFFDRRLKYAAASEYPCHSSSVFVPLGADQALEVSWLSCCNCNLCCRSFFFSCYDTEALLVQ